MLRFVARLKLLGINPYILVSAARAHGIKAGWRKPLPVLVRVNGHPTTRPWRINMMPNGNGAFYLYVHGEVRRVSNTKVGDRVQVEIAFDAAFRNGPMHRIPARFLVPLVNNSNAM